MGKFRTYIACIGGENMENVLPMITLVMMSLMLSKNSMKASEVSDDLAGNKKASKQLYQQVWYSLRRLEEMDAVTSLKAGKYKPSAKGIDRFKGELDRASKASSWGRLSDSKFYHS
jgi:hypothetical protein